MKLSINIAGTMATVAAAISLTIIGQPALADDVIKFLQQLTGRQEIAVRTVTLSDLETRRGQLESRIASALSSGKIKTGQADDFRKELDRISKSEMQCKADENLSLDETISLVRDLNVLSAWIEAVLSGRPAAETVFAERKPNLERRIIGALPSGRLAATQASTVRPDSRKSAIVKRITDGAASGWLTSQEQARLRHRFNKLVNRESRYRFMGGSLSADEKRDLDRQFVDLNHLVDRLTHNRRVTWNKSFQGKRTRVLARIEAGVNAGSITTTEGKKLRKKLDGIVAQASSLRASDGVLSAQERSALSTELNRLSSKVRRELSDQQTVYFPVRQHRHSVQQ